MRKFHQDVLQNPAAKTKLLFSPTKKCDTCGKDRVAFEAFDDHTCDEKAPAAPAVITAASQITEAALQPLRVANCHYKKKGMHKSGAKAVKKLAAGAPLGAATLEDVQAHPERYKYNAESCAWELKPKYYNKIECAPKPRCEPEPRCKEVVVCADDAKKTGVKKGCPTDNFVDDVIDARKGDGEDCDVPPKEYTNSYECWLSKAKEAFKARKLQAALKAGVPYNDEFVYQCNKTGNLLRVKLSGELKSSSSDKNARAYFLSMSAQPHGGAHATKSLSVFKFVPNDEGHVQAKLIRTNLDKMASQVSDSHATTVRTALGDLHAQVIVPMLK